ncbi:MAG: discoidin domain-containing protein, partial [bacterium]
MSTPTVLAVPLAVQLLLAPSSAGAQARRASAAPTTLVSFDDPDAWTAAPSDGVRLALRPDSGIGGRATRFEFDFQGHAGYAVARHAFTPPPLPPHWAMTLRVRGAALPNTLELKFIDASGQNVWWMRKVPLTVTSEWQTIRFRTSDLSFAWGPLGGGAPHGLASIEIAITAGAGGAGWIDLDDLTLVPLPLPVAESVRPRVTVSSVASGATPESLLPVDFARAPGRVAPTPASGWRSSGDSDQQITFDFGGPRELSGLVLDWDAADWATDYDIQQSDDGAHWTTIREVHGSAGGRRFVHLPELESGWLRLALH